MLGVPSYYGGCLFSQFARLRDPEPFTYGYLRKALFEGGEVELLASPKYCDIYLDWGDPANMNGVRQEEPNEGWYWDGSEDGFGVSWGGCVESLDEILRHGVEIPSLEQFEEVVLIAETSEEIPSSEYVRRVFRAFGELGILERVKGLLVGRPQAWSPGSPNGPVVKAAYREKQRQTVLGEFRKYNGHSPVVQNLDFGHTNPQICVPFGKRVRIAAKTGRIFSQF